MDMDPRDSALLTEEKAILAVTVGIILLALLIIRPYIQYILFGIIFAYVLLPIHRRLVEHVRRDLSALVLTVMIVFVVALPLVYLVTRLTREAIAITQRLQSADFGATEIEAGLLDLGIEADVQTIVLENQEILETAAEMLAVRVGQTVQNLPNIIIGLTVTVFVVFVMLRDGERFVAWTRAAVPIRNGIQREFHQRINQLMWASIVGNGGAGFIQTVALGAAFWIIGFDKVLLLTALTFILTLLPIVGAFVIWLPLVGYLVVIGSPMAAAMLFVFGSLVSVSDFYTRPIIIGRSGALNSGVIVVGVFGGLVVFGPVGLLIGPVILGGAKVAIETLVRARNDNLDVAEQRSG